MATDRLELSRVQAWLRLHPAGFYAHFPPRQVNNTYFDTAGLFSYEQNLGGGSTRRKVRLRWYGDGVRDIQGVFEIKFKRNMFGWKISQPLAQRLDLPGNTWARIIASLRESLSPEQQIYLDLSRTPVLINRYQREYYQSADGLVRVTLDYDQELYDQRLSSVPNLTRLTRQSDDLVVEFKAMVEHHDRLSEAINGIPLRVGKYSKYVAGVQAMLG